MGALLTSAGIKNSSLRGALVDLLGKPIAESNALFVGVSAGSIAAASTFVETYVGPPRGSDGPLKSEAIVFQTPGGG